MNENKKKWSEEEFDRQEYEFLRYTLLYSKSLAKKSMMKKYEEKLSNVMEDLEYQRMAISPITSSEIGYTTFRGPATVSFMINFNEALSEEIKEELLYNLMHLYIDEENTIPLLLGKSVSNYRYIYLVVTDKAIALKTEYQEKIAGCLCKIVKEMQEEGLVNEDIESIISFILRNDIENSLKEQVITEFDEEVANEVYKRIETYLSNNFDLSIENLWLVDSKLSKLLTKLAEKL